MKHIDPEKLEILKEHAPEMMKDEDLALFFEMEKMNEKMAEKSEREEARHEEMMTQMKEMAEKEIPAPQVYVDAPIVNVPAPIVKVEPPKVEVKAPDPVIVPAPEITIEKVSFPEVQKVEVVNKDEPVEMDYEKMGKEIGKNIKVSGGGGGGLGAFSAYGAALDSSITDQLTNYKLTDIDDTTSTEYYGYTKKDGSWYIKQVTSTAVRFVKGTSGYTTSWTGKAALSYDYFYTTF